MDPVYLDHAATTPMAPGVLEAMMPHLADRYGNASSVHARGREARHAVEEARGVVARAFGIEPDRVWFTSGGTEADNTAVHGLASMRQGAAVTVATEHEAVLRPVARLRASGRETVILPPESDGSVAVERVADALQGDTAFVSVMLANNETGALNDIAAIAECCRDRGVPLHTDAVQMAAYADVSPGRLGADLVTVSGHKIGGPVGVGALLMAPDGACAPLIVGGGQERGRRGGTENVAAIVGFAVAVERAARDRTAETRRVEALRNRLADRLSGELGDVATVTTPLDRSAPHILHCTFGTSGGTAPDGEMLLLGLDVDGVQASAGSACASGAVEPSHVLLALGMPRARASSALRMSLGRTTTADEVDRAAAVIVRTVRRLLR